MLNTTHMVNDYQFSYKYQPHQRKSKKNSFFLWPDIKVKDDILIHAFTLGILWAFGEATEHERWMKSLYMCHSEF